MHYPGINQCFRRSFFEELLPLQKEKIKIDVAYGLTYVTDV